MKMRVHIPLTFLALMTLALFGSVSVVFAHTSAGTFIAQRTPSEETAYQASKTLVANGCKTLQVTLHGDSRITAPTVTCQDNKTGRGITSRSVAPNIGSVNCTISQIILFKDEFGGGTLCFAGKGTANLTDYCLPAPTICLGGFGTWNDQVTSYTSTSSGGIFANIDANALIRNFHPGDHVDFAGTPNNDTASSIRI